MVADHEREREGIRSPALYPAELRARNELQATLSALWGFWWDSQLPLGLRIASEDLIHRVQPFKRALHSIGRRMHVFLTDGDGRMSHDLHDREGVGIRSGFPQTGPESVPQGMYHKRLRQPRHALLGFHLRG